MSAAPTRLSRWSRLKAESRAGARGMKFWLPGDTDETALEEARTPVIDEAVGGEAPEAQSEAAAAGAAPGIAAEQQAEAEADLPDIEDLNAESDFTPFMSDKVSDAVRNMALRKLWRTNAVFANLDGLLDYGEDFTDAATVVAGMQSVYKVGRGMVDYEAEEAAKAAEAEAAEAEAEAESEVAEAAADDDAAAEGTSTSDEDLETGETGGDGEISGQTADSETGSACPAAEPQAAPEGPEALEVIAERPERTYQVVQRPDQD